MYATGVSFFVFHETMRGPWQRTTDINETQEWKQISVNFENETIYESVLTFLDR